MVPYHTIAKQAPIIKGTTAVSAHLVAGLDPRIDLWATREMNTPIRDSTNGCEILAPLLQLLAGLLHALSASYIIA
eukprot:scaffold223548_cov37-Prasinocladus_malaysianus.AAC.3